MRSMFMWTALIAAVGFSGCCGNGNCQLGNCLNGPGKPLIKRAASRQAQTGLNQASAPQIGEHGGAVSDCGCDAAPVTAENCTACGSDSVVSVSAPYACADSGCSGSAGGCSTGDCGGGCGCDSGAAANAYSAPVSSGCSTCGDTGEAVQYAPHASGSECSTCNQGASATPQRRGLFERNRSALADGNRGMGLGLKSPGKACAPDENPSLLSRRTRSLRSGGTFNSIGDSPRHVEPTAAQEPFQLGSNNNGGRRISNGIISDIRGLRDGHQAIRGCGDRGCGSDGKVCSRCQADHRIGQGHGHAARVAARVDARAGERAHAGIGGRFADKPFITGAHPYGGAIPHTNPAYGAPQSGIAPQYAYPYYTTRGPRDFLRDNPPSIGY